MLKVEIKKKKVNPWDWDNSIENKLKKSYEAQFLNNIILKDEIEKNNKKRLSCLRVKLKKLKNPIKKIPKNESSQLGLTYQTHDSGHEIGITP